MRGRSKDLQYFTSIKGTVLHNQNEYTLFLLILFGRREEFSCKVTLSLLLAIRVVFLITDPVVVFFRDYTCAQRDTHTQIHLHTDTHYAHTHNTQTHTTHAHT